jgi:hypothetical protein
MRWSLALYGFGLLVPFLTTATAPLLGGVAIEAAGGDYRWVWLVCSAAIVVSLLAMWPLRDEA